MKESIPISAFSPKPTSSTRSSPMLPLRSSPVKQPTSKRPFRYGAVASRQDRTGEEKTYEQVAGQIKHDIAESRVRTEIGNLRDKIEDERAAGSTIAEIGKKLGLKTIAVEAVDRSGRGPDGKTIAGLPQTPNVVAAAFASDVGVDTERSIAQRRLFVLRRDRRNTVARTPPRRSKDQVEKRWRDDEIAKRLQAKADDLVGKLKAGTAFAQAAGERE